MTLWIKHPRTGKPDSMMSLAIYGFIVSIGLAIGSLVAAIYFNNSSLLTGGAALCGAILTPVTLSYCQRKFTDKKYSNGTREDAPDVGDEQN